MGVSIILDLASISYVLFTLSIFEVTLALLLLHLLVFLCLYLGVIFLFYSIFCFALLWFGFRVRELTWWMIWTRHISDYAITEELYISANHGSSNIGLINPNKATTQKTCIIFPQYELINIWVMRRGRMKWMSKTFHAYILMSLYELLYQTLLVDSCHLPDMNFWSSCWQAQFPSTGVFSVNWVIHFKQILFSIYVIDVPFWRAWIQFWVMKFPMSFV